MRIHDVPPAVSIEAERAVLGAMLSDPETVIDDAMGKLIAEDFFHPAHQKMFDVMVQMRNANVPVDPSTVLQWVTDRKLGDSYGMLISDLAAGAIASLTAPAHIETVLGKSKIRSLVTACAKSIADLTERQHEPDAAINDAETRLNASVERPKEAEGVGAREGTDAVYRAIIETSERGDGMIGTATGMKTVDERTSGIEPTNVWYIGARPGIGKTNFALSWQLSMARLGIPTAHVNIEMSVMQLSRRLLSMESTVALTTLRNGRLSENEQALLNHAKDQLDAMPYRLHFTPTLTLSQLRSIARKEVRRHGIKVLFLDYIQLVKCPGCKDTFAETAEASKGVREIAGDLGIGIVALAQLNRESEKGAEPRMPRLSDLRESGQLEQDAHFVGLIHRDHEKPPGWKKGDPLEDYKNEGWFLPVKGRDIKMSPFQIFCNPRTAQFTDRITDTIRDNRHESAPWNRES